MTKQAFRRMLLSRLRHNSFPSFGHQATILEHLESWIISIVQISLSKAYWTNHRCNLSGRIKALKTLFIICLVTRHTRLQFLKPPISSIFRIFLPPSEATLCITVATKQVVTLSHLVGGVAFTLAGCLFLIFIFGRSYGSRQHPITFPMTNLPHIPSMQHLRWLCSLTAFTTQPFSTWTRVKNGHKVVFMVCILLVCILKLWIS